MFVFSVCKFTNYLAYCKTNPNLFAVVKVVKVKMVIFDFQLRFGAHYSNNNKYIYIYYHYRPVKVD